MHAKPLATIAEELNNVLTVIAMCTDELEAGPASAALGDLRDAVRHGTLLTRQLVLREEALEPCRDVSDIVATKAATVVVVDANDDLRRALANALESRGWSCVEASSSGDALRLLEAVRAVDALVVDTTANGRAFAARLLERYPSAAVLYTGYTADALVERLDAVVTGRAAPR